MLFHMYLDFKPELELYKQFLVVFSRWGPSEKNQIHFPGTKRFSVLYISNGPFLSTLYYRVKVPMQRNLTWFFCGCILKMFRNDGVARLQNFVAFLHSLDIQVCLICKYTTCDITMHNGFLHNPDFRKTNKFTLN